MLKRKYPKQKRIQKIRKLIKSCSTTCGTELLMRGLIKTGRKYGCKTKK